MLAHEIKNPLSGIRGAAQLLEQSAGDEDRTLTRLICDETDRIVKLVDRMEVFSDERPIEREPVNIHVVLDHVKRLAQSRLRPPHPVHRGIRSVAAAGARQPRPAGPGLPQSGQERRRGDRRERDRRRNHTDDGVPARRPAFVAGQPRRGSRCRSNSASTTTARAFRRTCCHPVRSVRDHQDQRDLASDLHWSPRSSAIMAASSNANPSPAARSSAF